MDPYHVLGVPPGATDSEIKAAYRKAAMRWHPDRNTASGPEAAAMAERQFKAVNDAYDYLSNSGGRGPGSGSSSSGGGGASSSQGSGRWRRRPWSSYAASGGHAGGGGGAYAGDDPFGFRTGRGTVGDHMRRIDRNLRVLYVSLALLAGLVYVAPPAPSPMEAAKARRRRERTAHARGETHRFTERANVSLAPGSPLFAANSTPVGSSFGRRHGPRTATARPWLDRAAGDAAWGGDATYERFAAAATQLATFEIQSSESDRPGRRWRTRSLGEAEQRAALHAGWQRARFGAKVVAGGGGGGGGDTAGGDGEVSNRSSSTGDAAPEWASGGFAGVGISRRVLPYQQRDGRGDEGSRGWSGGSEIQCANCGYDVARAARYCAACGVRVTSPGSVVRRLRADPQDTGTSVGRGRERAKAAALAAAARAESESGVKAVGVVVAADGASSDGVPS